MTCGDDQEFANGPLCENIAGPLEEKFASIHRGADGKLSGSVRVFAIEHLSREECDKLLDSAVSIIDLILDYMPIEFMSESTHKHMRSVFTKMVDLSIAKINKGVK